MTEPLVLAADHGAVRLLTLNRPQARNALSRDLIRAAYTVLTEADADVTGGVEMALCCAFLVASERAVFADTHVRVGILPGGGMTARLPQVVGAAMARRLSMTGEGVDAARAERIGLVTEVVAHERLLDRVLELAGQIAEVPGPVMLGLKEIYTTGAAAVVDPALAAEAKIAFAQHRDFDGLGDQFRAVSERNKRQIEL